MRRNKPTTLIAAALMLAAGAASATGATLPRLSDLRWHRRVLVIASKASDDAAAKQQHHILNGWKQGAADRDVSIVDVAGNHVSGVSDPPEVLRRQLALSSNDFQVLLIGKDGHVALRSARPIEASTLQGAIDAMPMRRAGER